MSVLPPAKLKAYLSAVKGSFLDQPPSSGTLSDAFVGVLKMELALRGVLVEDEKKLWSQIQSSVGKSLLVEQSASKIPKALLAGANVMAGRVTEAFYILLKASTSLPVGQNDSGNGSCDFLKDLVPYEETAGARQRAEDIQDERWLFLLLHKAPSSSLKAPLPNDGNEITFENYLNGILQVALGYYSTAALIQSDTPPMWKKLWDVWTLLGGNSSSKSDSSGKSENSPSFEAQIAIENLIRIAISKNNSKRASELQLRLIQSYLNPNRTSLIGASFVFPKKQKQILNKTIAQCFGDSLTMDLPLDKENSSQSMMLVEKARSTLKFSEPFYEQQTKEQQNESFVNSDILLYRYLQVQTLFAEEEAKIQHEAQEMKRRSTSQANLADCVVECGKSLVLSISNTNEDPFLVQARSLRDTTIAAWSLESREQTDNLESIRETTTLQLCFHWVDQSILKLKERAEIISRETSSYHAWNELLHFILPLLKEIERQISGFSGSEVTGDEPTNRVSKILQWFDCLHPESDRASTSMSEHALMKLIARIASILPTVVWMLLGDESNDFRTVGEELKLVVDILTGSIRWQESAESRRRQAEKEKPAVGSKETLNIVSTLQWQHAKASAACLSCQDDGSTIHDVTIHAISSSRKKQKRGYLSFLQCLVAWSGWFQNPWPYCTNLGDTRRLLANAKLDLGRPLTTLEEVLLQLARADAESLNGGFLEQAHKEYISVLGKLQDGMCSIDKHCTMLLQAHCHNGMARIEHANQKYTDYNDSEVSCTKKSLEIVDKLNFPPTVSRLSIWNLQSTFEASKAHELSVTRQLIADSLIHFGQFEEARLFLQNAVADSPLDADAALALGAFLFRVAFYVLEKRTPEAEKDAQIHLLKAAKLDPTKPNPFALLGIWYEENRDLKRALGCYMKCLKFDPCNPIAGRGVLRVSPNGDHRNIVESAMNKSSPFNGWAWRSTGLNKAYIDGDDGLAVVAILKALRCQDIDLPDKESLGIFYRTPSSKNVNEKAEALAEVGMCYRRLGRMTASIRAFRSSIEASGLDSIQSSTFISCAQVEQELGLFDEAAEKFATVIAMEEKSTQSVALYGHASALFSIAERDLMDGKAGAAFARIQLAVESYTNSTTVSGCEFKLLGDLYSFGASFPSSVFCDDKNGDVNFCIQEQLEFVAKGEDAFRSALGLQAQQSPDDKQGIAMKSSILCDIALNILLQGQLLSSLSHETTQVSVKYKLASQAFQEAIEYNPIHPASWCGLGCSVLRTDPLLAQHAFCRCIQIESMSPDAYANAGFLYTSELAFQASRSTMEALTQVADTPMMWINCAFMLEREAERCLDGDNMRMPEGFISQAADAYRASLQVMRHPEAQLGLSLTGRVAICHNKANGATPSSGLFATKRRDSFSFMKEYVDGGCHQNGRVSVIQGVMAMEKGVSSRRHAGWKDEIYTEGRAKVLQAETNEHGTITPLFDGTSVKAPAEGENRENNSSPLSEYVNDTQRGIWLQPDRSDLWLSLAKTFVKNGAVESARTAASRAADILWMDLIASSEARSKSLSLVDGKAISEASSLRHWLDQLGKTDVDPYAMQRALVMDPTNAMARRSLFVEK